MLDQNPLPLSIASLSPNYLSNLNTTLLLTFSLRSTFVCTTKDRLQFEKIDERNKISNATFPQKDTRHTASRAKFIIGRSSESG